MKKFLLISLFLIPIFNLNSQSFYSVEIGGGYATNVFSNYGFEYWDKGYVILISNEIALSSDFKLLQTISYQNYYFNESSYSLGLVVPAIYSFRIGDTRGESSQVYEASFGIRSMTPLYFFRTFTSVKAGIIYIDQGLINTSVEISEDFENYNKRNYSVGGKHFFNGLISLGLGGEFAISKNINLVLEGRLTTTFTDIILNTSITSQLQFLL